MPEKSGCINVVAALKQFFEYKNDWVSHFLGQNEVAIIQLYI